MEDNFKNVLSELECPVCNEFMHTVIPLCTSGHSICKSCRQKCSVCPICQAIFGDMRNYTLEKVICAMKFSCKNKTEGCNVTMNPINMYLHLHNCEYEKYVCPLTELQKCAWTGKETSIKDHLKAAHSRLNNVYDSQSITTTVGFISAFKAVFKVNRRYLSDLGLVQWSVQYVGPKSKSENYFFRVDFIDPEDYGYALNVSAKCIPFCKDNEAFDSDKVCVHEEMLKYYKVGNIVAHRLIILLKRNYCFVE